ncbi:hypothetical protein ASPZODRAFT_49644, partial [Penicilliopsis zonata CBS 506.65]
SKIRQEVDELWRLFMTATSDPALVNTICVLDALDECRPDDRDRLLQKFTSFHQKTHSSAHGTWLKFLITSRPYHDIKYHFQTVTDSFPHVHLQGEEENDQIHEEINLVVKMRVAELAKALSLSPYIHRRLEQQLLQMQHRTYLWLYLALEDIRTMFQNSLRPDEESIRLIPSSVDNAYRKILANIPLDQAKTVRKIFQIIVASRRPLTIEEMAMALGVAISPHSLTPEEAGLDPERMKRIIRQLCGLFVFINNSRIYLIHQTAREFL